MANECLGDLRPRLVPGKYYRKKKNANEKWFSHVSFYYEKYDGK